MVMGLLFTIVGDIFSPTERGRYVGLFSAVWGVASIFGPTLGGWLTDQWSWRACFWVNLPVGAIAVAAIYLEFPNMKPHAGGTTHRLGRIRDVDRLCRAAAARAHVGHAVRMELHARRIAARLAQRSCLARFCTLSQGRRNR